ncbi:CAP domain-containing protein [Daedaleopsis nitida]|nr:CAP domain-containing protein [Daedaleopsis nitida]
MNRLLYLLFALPLFLSSITTAEAGPACARRNEGTDACIQLCRDKWGWPGFEMGTDRWGSVLTKTVTKTNDMGAVITQACRVQPSPVSTSSSSTSTRATSTPIANVIASASFGTVNASATPSLRPLVGNTTSITLKLVTSARPKSSTSTRTSTQRTTPVATTSSSSSSTTTTTSKPAPAPTTTSTPPPKPTTTTKPATTTSKASAPKTTTQSSASDGGNSSDGATSQSDITAYLQAHNSVRSQHGAAALTWSDDLAAKAQQWANKCVFQHSGGQLGKFGENLAAGTGSSYSIGPAVKSWTDEVSDYNPSNPQASHFTQVVWKGTQQVGCAVQSCNGIFPASFGAAKYYVCEYFPRATSSARSPRTCKHDESSNPAPSHFCKR